MSNLTVIDSTTPTPAISLDAVCELMRAYFVGAEERQFGHDGVNVYITGTGKRAGKWAIFCPSDEEGESCTLTEWYWSTIWEMASNAKDALGV